MLRHSKHKGKGTFKMHHHLVISERSEESVNYAR